MSSSSSDLSIPEYEIRLDDRRGLWLPVTITARLIVVHPETGQWVETDIVDEMPEVLPNPIYGTQQADWLAIRFEGVEGHHAKWTAKLTSALATDDDFYNKAAEPFELLIRVRPRPHLSGLPETIEQRCRVIVANPRGSVHWHWRAWSAREDRFHHEGYDTPIRIEADGTDRVTLDLRYSRWLPAVAAVDTDKTVFFSHNLPETRDGRPRTAEIRRVQPGLFHPDAKDKPWDSESSHRERSRWQGRCALPPDIGDAVCGNVSDQRYEFDGEVRVRVWNVKEGERTLLRTEGYDADGYPRGNIESPRGPIHQQFIPLQVVAPTLAVRHVEPDLPLPADGREVALDFEAIHERDRGRSLPSQIRRGQLHWEIDPSEEWKQGRTVPTVGEFIPDAPGQISTRYTPPARRYVPSQEYRDLFRFYQLANGVRRDVDEVEVHLSPELMGEIELEKPGLRFRSSVGARRQDPESDTGWLDVHYPAGTTPMWIRYPIGSLHLENDEQFPVRHARIVGARAETEAAGVHVEIPGDRLSLEARLGDQLDRYGWDLPELAEGLQNQPHSRHVDEVDDGYAFDITLNEGSQKLIDAFEAFLESDDVVHRIHPYLRPGTFGGVSGRTHHVLELLQDQRTLMGRQLAECERPDHDRAWSGTELLHQALDGAYRVDNAVSRVFDKVLDALTDLFSLAVDALISLKELPKRLFRLLGLEDEADRRMTHKMFEAADEVFDTLARQVRIWARTLGDMLGATAPGLKWAAGKIHEGMATLANWMLSLEKRVPKATIKQRLRAALPFLTAAAVYDTMRTCQARVDGFVQRPLTTDDVAAYKGRITTIEDEIAAYRLRCFEYTVIRDGFYLAVDFLQEIILVCAMVGSIAALFSPAVAAALIMAGPFLGWLASAGITILKIKAVEVVWGFVADLAKISEFGDRYQRATLPLASPASS